MYAGHIGIALGAKGSRPALPLIALILAAQGPDWVDTILTGMRFAQHRSEMWSHSIPSALLIAALLATASFIVWRSPTALVLPAVYLLHLPADYLTGMKPLAPGAPSIGLRLYDHPPIDFVLEAVVITVGWRLWKRSLPDDRRDRPAAWLLLVGLLFVQAAADVAFGIRAAGRSIL
jgi:hypothetical protein